VLAGGTGLPINCTPRDNIENYEIYGFHGFGDVVCGLLGYDGIHNVLHIGLSID
jgi:hypothetical protein